MMKRPRVSTGAIIEKDGKILLAKRNVEPFKGYWCLPGGKIEHDEKAEDTIKRELKEEIGVDFEPTEFLGYLDEVNQEAGHCVSLWFKGTFTGEIKTAIDEISEVKWFPIEEARKMKLAYTNNDALEKYMK